MTPFVSAYGLALQRGDTRICNAFAMELMSGECVHLTGPNGSGKTSLMQALCGLLQPEAGQISWRVGTAATHAHYCAHQDALKDAWTVTENLRWTLRVHAARVTPAQWDTCFAQLRLEGVADTPVARLSQGEKRRAALARLVLLHRPVWLLDEPFNALDFAGRQCVVDWINRHTMQGGAVLFSGHSGQPAGLNLSRTISMDAQV